MLVPDTLDSSFVRVFIRSPRRRGRAAWPGFRSVLLAVIGPNWLDVRDEHGNRRLDDPNDFVRIEIAAALQRSIPVIPVLLEGARIPKAIELPEDLKELALRNGMEIRHASFQDDMDRLIRGLEGPSRFHSHRPSRAQEYQRQSSYPKT